MLFWQPFWQPFWIGNIHMILFWGKWVCHRSRSKLLIVRLTFKCFTIRCKAILMKICYFGLYFKKQIHILAAILNLFLAPFLYLKAFFDSNIICSVSINLMATKIWTSAPNLPIYTNYNQLIAIFGYWRPFWRPYWILWILFDLTIILLVSLTS